jgi:hypothetical protein
MYTQENIKSVRINATKSKGSQMPVYLTREQLNLDERWAALIVEFSFGHLQMCIFLCQILCLHHYRVCDRSLLNKLQLI